MSNRANLVVLASGSGTNLQAIIDACKNGSLNAEVTAVVSDKQEAVALQRAKKKNIPTEILISKNVSKDPISREEYDANLAEIVQKFELDLVILAGWMHILSMAFLSKFQNQVINLHPALPGMFPGTLAIERAFIAFQEGKINKTGVMVHFVPDEGIDVGPVILKEEVPIYLDDDLEKLEDRIHKTEHRILIEAIEKIIREK